MPASVANGLGRKSHILLRRAAFSRPPTRLFGMQSGTSTPFTINRNTGIPPTSNGLKLFSRPELGFQHLSLPYLRVSRGVTGSLYRPDRGFCGSGNGSSGGGASGSNGSSLLSWYQCLLERYPVLTKAITSGILTLVGDLICQIWIDQVPSLDVKRTSIFMSLGLVLVGPTLHFWYLSLSKLVTVPGAYGASLRLLLDQFLFAPVFIGIFLSTLVTLEGNPSNIIPKLRQEWLSSVVANWQLWIPFQFLNFRFVPQQYQVLAANCISLIWNVILSDKAHRQVTVK